MIALILATLLAVETPTPQALPPIDWSTLPQLPLRQPPDTSADIAAFVRQEVKNGRCAAATRYASGWTLDVDLAVLIDTDDHIRRIVPRAIHCPTVEQYAAGLLLTGARDNIDAPPADGDRWYRTRLTFTWGA